MTSTTSQDRGRSGLKPARSGIGMRLTLAFACIAGLTAIAGGASSVLSLQGGAIVDSLGASTLPTVTASLSFAQRSSVLAAEAPALATQKDVASLDVEATRIAAMRQDQARRLADLRSRLEAPAMLDPVQRASDELGAKIDELKTSAAERIGLQAQLDQKVADSLGAYQDLMDFVRPLQEATQTSVDALMAAAPTTDDTHKTDAGGDLKAGVASLRTLMDVQANGNLAFGMLSAAANAETEDAARDIRTQYNWAELYLGKAIKSLGAGPDAERIATLGAVLLGAGQGNDSVFFLKQRRGEKDQQSAALLQGMRRITATLSQNVDTLVEAQQRAAASAVIHSGDVTRQSLVVNGALSGTVLLAALLIGWLYVHRVVVRRLNGLAGVMGRLAGGDRQVSVDTRGRDEITAMAGAVEVFRGSMLRGDGLAADATRLAEERETTRRHADEERAEVAARQAIVVEGLAGGLAKLAKGDLTCLLDHPFATEYEGLRRDFNEAAAQLKSVMQQIVANADNLRTGTSEISSATEDLSRRTERQAASLEETAAALDEITATVRRTSEGATHARDVVGVAKADAERSGNVVREAVSAMSGIEKSAAEIGQIVGVIDEIAFQTNLLALNAGVEAARVGDAGRGFAVVASEVRALAQRSADAAKEIKALIRASSAHVEQGVDLVGQTGLALEHILSQVAEINTIVSEIAASAKEQTTGLDQVNTAVNQMDQMTQQNAAMVEQTTAASHSLVRDTDVLAGLIGRFDVGRSGTRATADGGRTITPASARVVALKSTGRGGAARKPATNWREF